MFKHSVVKSGKQWKVRVRKESKLQMSGREKRRMRREKVMEAEASCSISRNNGRL